MIVVGLDVHKQALTAVAVDELGRAVAERTCAVSAEPLLEWARSLEAERLWALEDCRHVTRGLEQALLAAGEQLLRVPPRLTAPQRRRGEGAASPTRSTRSRRRGRRSRNRGSTSPVRARRRCAS
jgi:transposase